VDCASKTAAPHFATYGSAGRDEAETAKTAQKRLDRTRDPRAGRPPSRLRHRVEIAWQFEVTTELTANFLNILARWSAAGPAISRACGRNAGFSEQWNNNGITAEFAGREQLINAA
jgi:hypothetical protein